MQKKMETTIWGLYRDYISLILKKIALCTADLFLTERWIGRRVLPFAGALQAGLGSWTYQWPLADQAVYVSGPEI